MELPFDPDPSQERDLEREDRLKTLGASIAEKRDEAVAFRKNSGIEDVWMYCEEAYIGIDDTNREAWANAKWAKPTTMEGPLTRESFGGRSSSRSNIYVRMTARYVDCGAAKMQEILLPIDDKPFSIDPTPVPEVVSRPTQIAQGMNPAAAGPMPSPVAPQALPQGTAPGMPPAMQAAPPVDPVVQAEGQAKDSAEKAEKRIHDWMVEGGFSREMRKVIHDAARIGTGVLKAPYSTIRKSKALNVNEGSVELIIEEKICPGMSWVDPWNCFPDPACGEDINDGEFFFERDLMSPRKLKDLKKLEEAGYLPDQIDKVLKEGPGKCYIDDYGNDKRGNDPSLKRRRYEIFYYYGTVSREDLSVLNSGAITEKDDKKSDFYAILTLVNDTIIRAVINPLDSGAFPYKVMPWSRRSGSWAGIGISEQCKEPQRMINAATRAMMNNAGRSGGIQIILDRDAIIPMDGNWELTPEKLWEKSPNSIYDDVRKAMTAIEFPNVTPQMMQIIEYAFRLAEESTNIPLVTQGQSGETSPNTFGQAQLQNNNANQLLRSVAYMFDDCITSPVVNDLYEWLLLDPDVPNDEKGDFIINAHGSAALVERAVQDQFLQQIGQLVLNPAFELSPARWMKETLLSKRMDPRKLELTDEEKAKLAQQAPPPAPQVQAAQIRAETDLKKTQMLVEADLQMDKTDTDRDLVYVQAEQQRNATDHEARMRELEVKRELAILEYANREKTTIETIRADLAKESAKINLQRELAMASNAMNSAQHSINTKADLHKHATKQVVTPPVEPAGRAPDGQAFAR